MEQLLDEPDANYWYAFGRIAEQYGENEVAAADYKQVKKPGKACGWRGALPVGADSLGSDAGRGCDGKSSK
jgi:hypothetical protein